MTDSRVKRRSSEDFPQVPEVLRICLLGGFSVSVRATRTIEENDWRLKKAAGLVKLLALAPRHKLHREQVMDLLWPKLDASKAANNLRYTLHNARRTLEPTSTATSYLQLQGKQLLLCPEGEVWVDVEAFEEAAGQARRSREPGAYKAALELYAGELLPEDRYEGWAEERRQELRRTYLTLLVELASLYEEREEYEPAIEALREVLREEPTHEGAHVSLMRLYALCGQHQEALGQYERLRGVLLRELDREPAAASRRLYEEISERRFAATHAPQTERLPEQSPATPNRHNLPNTLTSFIGREREKLEVKRLLYMTCLLTLTGAGGSGKTRLALEVAKDLVGAYPDGVWLVELAGLSDPALVPQEVADALKVREQPGRSILDTLVEVLREKQLLLVLDNCEHLIDAAASLVEKLLGSCAGLRILATSREPLGVAGETKRRVPSLTVPDAGGGVPPAQNLAQYEAVELFVDRARSRRPTFVLTPQKAQAVAEVCRKLEGIPLAIELAAARAAVLSVEQIARRLEGSIKLLAVSEGLVADPRHKTLRGALDWSYELLEEPERRLFERLSVFAGGWTLEAAEAVGAGGGIEEEEVLDLLSELIDKSLVVAELEEEWGNATMRYRMLEPVRQYAQEKLEESRQAEQTKHRHAEWYLKLAEEADKESSGPAHSRWLRRLEAEHDNLRGALGWSLDEGDAELGLRLAGALWLFWFMRGHSLEGRRWLGRGISLGSSSAAKAKALNGAGWIAMFQGDYEASRTLLEESLTLYRELEDEEGVASSLNFLGYVALLGCWEDIPVEPLLEEALALKPRIKNRRTIANTIILAGLEALLLRGEGDEGVALHEEALALYREMEDKWGITLCLVNLGLMAEAQGHRARAKVLLRELMHLSREVDDKFSNMYSFFGLACVADSEGHTVRAARLWGVSEAILEAAGLQLPPSTHSVMKYESRLAGARAQLGDAAFEEAWAEGKAMTIEQAIEYALSEEESAPPMTPTPEEPLAEKPLGKLTQREEEIAALVAQGLTNRQIAKELTLSKRTVDNHVDRILKKLGVQSRGQVLAAMQGESEQLFGRRTSRRS